MRGLERERESERDRERWRGPGGRGLALAFSEIIVLAISDHGVTGQDLYVEFIVAESALLRFMDVFRRRHSATRA